MWRVRCAGSSSARGDVSCLPLGAVCVKLVRGLQKYLLTPSLLLPLKTLPSVDVYPFPTFLDLVLPGFSDIVHRHTAHARSPGPALSHCVGGRGGSVDRTYCKGVKNFHVPLRAAALTRRPAPFPSRAGATEASFRTCLLRCNCVFFRFFILKCGMVGGACPVGVRQPAWFRVSRVSCLEACERSDPSRRSRRAVRCGRTPQQRKKIRL